MFIPRLLFDIVKTKTTTNIFSILTSTQFNHLHLISVTTAKISSKQATQHSSELITQRIINSIMNPLCLDTKYHAIWSMFGWLDFFYHRQHLIVLALLGPYCLSSTDLRVIEKAHHQTIGMNGRGNWERVLVGHHYEPPCPISIVSQNIH